MTALRSTLVLLLVLALVGAGAAWADEAAEVEAPPKQADVPAGEAEASEASAEASEDGAGAGAPTDAPADEEAELSPEDLERIVFGSPMTILSRVLLTFLPALLGAVLLLVLAVRALERRSALRAGVALPEAPPRPGPTVPFSLPQALGLALVAYVLLQVAAAAAVTADPELRHSVWLGFALMAVVAVPLAALVLLRRARLRGGVERPGGRSLLRGYLTYCVGTAAALAITYPWAAFLLSVGEQPKIQKIIQRAADPGHPELLWLTAFFAVVVAPFTEEAIFRGLLFPAVRKWIGEGPRAFWLAAILVSFAFAASHEGLLSFSMGPLFGLAMVLTWAFDRTDSLLVPMLGHAFFNASTVIPMLVARAEGLM